MPDYSDTDFDETSATDTETLCESCPFVRGRAVAGLLNGLPEEEWDEASAGVSKPCMGAAVTAFTERGAPVDPDVLRRTSETDTEAAPVGRVSMRDRVCAASQGRFCAAAVALAEGRTEVGGENIMDREAFVNLHNSAHGFTGEE